MEFVAALNEIADRIGLSVLVPDETGSVTFLFDGKHEVSFVSAMKTSVTNRRHQCIHCGG